MTRRDGFTLPQYLLFCTAGLLVFALCVCLGSVTVPLSQILRVLLSVFCGYGGSGNEFTIIAAVRLPRVLCVGLMGAALALSGAATQGLLRNPLADAGTLGVSSGAALGAVLAIAFGFSIPGLPGGGVMAPAAVFAFLSMLAVFALALRLDYSLATETIILIGVVFSMFASSLVSLVVAFAGQRVRSVLFWTMGSLAGASYGDALALALTLLLCGAVLLCHTRELNAFALGEENARSVGVNLRRVKITVMAAASALIGVCVAVGGTVGFVGLVIPHIARMLTGPNHRRLLPASLFCGAAFLMLADLLARTLLSPRELPLGVITSLVGAAAFVWIFRSARKVRQNG